MGRNILILCYTDLAADARVLRQIHALVDAGYHVSTAALGRAGHENGTFIRIEHEARGHLHLPRLLRKAVSLCIRTRYRLLSMLGMHDAAYWTDFRKSARKKLRGVDADLIIANDIDTLPLALALRRPGTKVLFDAHEYAPLQGEGNAGWMRSYHARNTYLCKRYMPLADQVFTVSPGIVDLYLRLTGVRALLLTNAPAYQAESPIFNTQAPIRLVHHGIATLQRRTHELVGMMDLLGAAFHLQLYLVLDVEPEYGQRIRSMCAARSNVSLSPPIPPDGICAEIRQYDIGIHRLPPHSTNHRLALPNKFLEFIQARLAIVVTPTISMAAIVQKEGLGMVARDHSIEALAEAIATLDIGTVNNCKANAERVAHRYSAQGNMELLRRTVEELIGVPGNA